MCVAIAAPHLHYRALYRVLGKTLDRESGEGGPKMLAAVSRSQSQPLDLFVFALARVGRGDAAVPPSLRDYINKVIQQAKALANDPASVEGPLLPEAVQLALEMTKKKNFRDQVADINADHVVTQQEASTLLTAVEDAFVR